MAKKTETKVEKIEREYVIPLREKCRVVPRYKKTPKAIKSVKEFIAKHMKVYSRDLNQIKLDMYLNEALWSRGIRKPLYKVKVKAIKEGDIVRVELVDYPDKLKFKKLREEKAEKAAEEAGKKKKAKKVEETPKEEKTEEEKKEDQVEEKEKKSAVVEAGAEMEKSTAKKVKHTPQYAGKMTQQKHQVRKALAK